jgi:ATP/maltotriose-dependent transcriptional regulator MalT
MDRYATDQNPASLRKSRDLYAEAFGGSRDDYYTGINAAAKSIFIGTPADLEKANGYAKRVLEIVGETAVPGDYWKTATVAEAFLMRREYGRAAELYGDAVSIAPEATGQHRSTWTQASRLMASMNATAAQVSMIKEKFPSAATNS